MKAKLIKFDIDSKVNNIDWVSEMLRFIQTQVTWSVTFGISCLKAFYGHFISLHSVDFTAMQMLMKQRTACFKIVSNQQFSAEDWEYKLIDRKAELTPICALQSQFITLFNFADKQMSVFLIKQCFLLVNAFACMETGKDFTFDRLFIRLLISERRWQKTT